MIFKALHDVAPAQCSLSHIVFLFFALAFILGLKDTKLISVSRLPLLFRLGGALLSQIMALPVSSLKA